MATITGNTHLAKKTKLRLPGEQPAQVDANAGDTMIARPGAQHLPRTAAKIEHTGARFQTQCRAEDGEFFGCERVMDAVGAFGDGEDPWNIQGRKFPYGVNRFGRWLTPASWAACPSPSHARGRSSSTHLPSHRIVEEQGQSIQ